MGTQGDRVLHLKVSSLSPGDIDGLRHAGLALTIEAGMRARESVFVTVVSMNVELAEAIHALELLEPIEGNLAGSGDKLQKLGSLLLVKGPDGAPEPLNLRRCRRVIVVLSVVLPIVDINVG